MTSPCARPEPQIRKRDAFCIGAYIHSPSYNLSRPWSKAIALLLQAQASFTSAGYALVCVRSLISAGCSSNIRRHETGCCPLLDKLESFFRGGEVPQRRFHEHDHGFPFFSRSAFRFHVFRFPIPSLHPSSVFPYPLSFCPYPFSSSAFRFHRFRFSVFPSLPSRLVPHGSRL